jgi:glyoxylase-like metal-dependent hydrolase (beta-lactamase superfamily II)
MSLQILQLQAGQADNFTYLVWCPNTLKAMVVDPSFAPELLLEAAAERGLHIHILANTHGHRDHIAGNDSILKATGAVLAASPIDLPQAQEQLSNGSRISLGEEQIEVWHTPGHTPGSMIFKVGDAVITGDTLFVSRCGRADLPGGDVEALYRSLQRIKKLPPQTRVYPGHDYGPTPSSTIAWELENNDFLKCPDLDSFIRLRMG